MNNEEKIVISIQIDDTLPPEKASKDFSEDHELSLCDFIEPMADESYNEDYSYSTNSVKKAGKRLRKKEGDLKSATAIIQRFRAAHDKPLNTIAYIVERCCRECGMDVKPVTRLKRLETIIDKLQRKSLDGKTQNSTCVTNMNDIGGCRAIFPDLKSLKQVSAQLQMISDKEGRARIKNIDDYIENPKTNDCGYRSLHIIYRYDHASGKSFNIEVQLRTRFQHLWATTVEIVDILENANIKTHSHGANEDKSAQQVKWEELLSIMSRNIAAVEGDIIFTEEDRVQISTRLYQLNDELNALNKLKSFKLLSNKVKVCHNSEREYILLIVDERLLRLTTYEFSTYDFAIFNYNNVEKMNRNRSGVNILLISTKDVSQLSEAYPNYLGDCASFINLFKDAMGQFRV